MRLAISFVLALLCVTFVAHAQAIPLMINYQGKVEVNGVPFDGAGDFKFALTNQAGDTYYWTNDGSTPTPPNAATNPVSLTVTAGSYSVVLGDTSLSNMTAVPASVFTTPGIFLRIWFNDGSTGEQLLLPDKQLTSVPYAYMAEKVAPLSITGEHLTRESVWPEHEGRSNTIVSYFAAIGGSGEVSVGTIPGNKTFVITDVVYHGSEDQHWNLELNYELGGDTTILITLMQWMLPGAEIAQPISVDLKAGLPVPAGAILKARNRQSGLLECTIAGFEFENN